MQNENFEEENLNIIDYVISIAVHLINPFIAQTLWSLILVPVFNAPELNYIQMFGLIWLIKTVLY